MGKIVEMANGEDLFNRPLHPYTRLLLNAIPKMDPFTRRTESPMKEEAQAIPSDQVCLFQPRCPHSREKCQTEEPLLVDEGKDHFVACHFISSKMS
jgi:oligopeptide/dipeptide ABC transporter ATP-binding protein